MAFSAPPQPHYYQSGPPLADGSLVQVAAAPNGLSIWLPSSAPGQQPGTPFMYLPGDVVRGKLRANVKSRTTARAVRMKFVAEAYIHFHRGSGKERRDYHHTVPLCPQLHLTLQGADKNAPASSSSHQPNFYLEPGVAYEWDFSFQLPQGSLPGTFYFTEGTRVTYNLCCYVDIPNWPDVEVRTDLNVAAAPSPITPEMARPLELQPLLGVNSCCCLFPQGEALLTLALPRGGAVPFVDGWGLEDGQLLPVVVGVDNTRSKRALGPVALKLKGEVLLTASGGAVHRTPFTVAEVEIAPAVNAGESLAPRAVAFPRLVMRRTPALNVWQALAIQCPSTDIPGALRVSYRLSLVAQNGCGSKLKAAVPLAFVPTYPERGAVLPVPMPAPMPMPAVLPEPSAPLPEPEPVCAVAVAEPLQYGMGGTGVPATAAQGKPYTFEYGPGTGLGGAPLASYGNPGEGKQYPPAV